jgi:membrane-bound ClpP family serine protease
MNERIPILIGGLLIVLGLGGTFGTGTSSITALIPAFWGVALLLLGLATSRERLRLPALYGVAAVAVLGVVGAAPGLIDLGRWLAGNPIERPVAAAIQTAMVVLCLPVIAFAWKAVRDERRHQHNGRRPFGSA